MVHEDSSERRIEQWLAALERRHLAVLTPSEVARALRALSSCYVERRGKLTDGGALGTAGKRAAFALFYSPVHLLLTQQVIRSLSAHVRAVEAVLDLGCGTGSAGVAWALEAGNLPVRGADRHQWAVAEANWTYAQFALAGRAIQQDVSRVRFAPNRQAGIVAAYTVNELADEDRAQLLPRLLHAHARGSTVLIIEPIARRLTPWWNAWEEAFENAGGRADEWRFPIQLPPRQHDLARSAGLRPEALTARTLLIE
jgi:Methyltransferase domain